MDELARRLRGAVEALSPDERRRLGTALGLPRTAPDLELVGVVRTTGTAPSPETLRAYLRDRLPGYMVPRRIVFVDALPRTPAGKVDRRALAADPPTAGPGETAGDAGSGTLPRTEVEEVLAKIWREVLGSDLVYVDDDFFELGGDSLLSIRIIARAKQAGIEIDPGQFFATPTIAALAEAGEGGVAAGAPDAGEATAGVPPPPLPAFGPGRAPLTSAQEGFWFLDRLDPGNPAYNVAVRLDITGPLDPDRLARSWRRLLERHDGLRATVGLEDEEPWLDVLPVDRFALERVDLTGTADPEDRVQSLARDSARTRFDLAGGPLVRGALCTLDGRRSVLLLTLHHMVVDGESVRLLLEDLGDLYRTPAAAGTDSGLPPGPSIRDWAGWERSRPASDAVEHSRRYWLDRFTELPERLELPGAVEDPEAKGSAGATLVRVLPMDLADAVAAVAAREGCTPFALLLAVFQILLGRHTGRDVIVTGSPVRHRPHPAVERAVGYFQNMLPLRTDLSGDPSFRQALARTRETVAGALAHRDVPFEQLVAELAPSRGVGSTPLFQTTFTYRDGTRGEDWRTALDLPGVEVEASVLPTGAAKFELGLEIERSADGLRVVMEYATGRLDDGTARALLDRFEVLLRGALADPEAQASALPVMTPDERRRVLEEWAGDPVDDVAEVRPTLTVRALVEEAAATHPERVALVDQSGCLTYREFDRRANRLAHLLRERGVGPEAVVAVLVPPSIDQVVTLLAVWKAGGAFLSLDPTHPPDRRRAILRDAGPVLLVTVEAHADASDPGLVSVILDRDGEAIGSAPPTPPGVPLESSSLAYVIYTSGSTGSPKGVEVEHGALANLVAWHRGAFGVTPDDRASQVAAGTFDASVWETWGTLGAGATLVIAPPGLPSDPGALADWMGVERVSLAFAPTPVAEAILRAHRPLPQTVRLLMAGGDQLRYRPGPDHQADVWNLYGPTECTVIATAGPVAPGPDPRLPDIGRPIRAVRVYVLDRAGQPAPPGVAGELCIAGAGLARGYRADPDATAAAFRPAGFPEAEGVRLYHTGDRVRYRRDGTLEFLGRMDRQVKIRGQRLEPGEVEAALLTLPSVAACVVDAREDVSGEPTLVAFVVPAGEAMPDPTTLRASLASRLPPAMVPTRFVPLPELPLNASGKVDRAALPAVEPPSGSGERPRGGVEEVVAAVWTQVLGRIDPGRHDDFFALGGHSLKVTAVVARLERILGVRIPLTRFFEDPTVAGIAALVESVREGDGPAPERLAASSGGGGNRRPLSPDQARLWYLHQLDPEHPTYHIPLVYRLSGELDRDAVQASLDDLRRRHTALRTVVEPGDEGPVQVVRPPEARELPVTDLASVSPAGFEDPDASALARVVKEEVTSPFDPAVGPLMRARLIRTSRDEHHLVLTLHHLIADGWSAGIIARELSALYRARVEDGAPELPAVPVQYGDWCAARAAWLETEAGLAEVEDWRRALEDVPPLVLPTDRPRPGRPSYRGGLHSFRIGPSATAELHDLCRDAGVTPFMLLLAAFEVLLHRYSGQTDLAVGSVVAGRSTVETEEVVGFFANTVVLRTEVLPDLPFREVLNRVRRTTLEALTRQRVPFGRVVEAVEPPRDPSRNPLFQVLFVLQNQDAPRLDLPGLEAEAVVPDTGSSKFDLTLTVEPRDDALAFHLEYAVDLFEPATMRSLETHFRTLLSSLAEGLDEPVALLPMVADRSEWALEGPSIDLPPEVGLHDRVARQAARTPDATAVRSEDGGRLTYRELQERSDRIAGVLLERGVEVGDVVAVGLPRTPELVAALLGVLKAGAAYLPLDPDFPTRRLEHIVGDAGARLLITEDGLADRFPAGPDCLLLGEALQGVGSDHPSDDFPTVRPSHLAYLIYTSGSTGGPKGVEVTHGNAVNLLEAMRERPGLDGDTRLLAVTTLSFDISVLELFGPLGVGGTVLLARAATAADGPALRALLEADRPTTMQATPTTWQMLLDAGWEGDPDLRVLVGGEALPPELARTLAGSCREVWNMYGPTETTVWSTCWRVEAGTGSVRIGTPVANTTVYILDERRRPVPVGVPGELYIGGTGVTRGYHGRPDLTAERFLEDPFAPDDGARMYRTGDRGRVRHDGTLEFLGRRDGQVKVRGYRIEVGEVEQVLEAHPAVRQAVVKVFAGGTADARLVAFVAPDPAGLVTGSELRRFVRERLPRYMVPGMVSMVEGFPTTPNGKVDRNALADPLGSQRRDTEVHQPPATDTERVIARVWSDLLPGVRVGRADNFFELGGHSLLSIRAVAEIERRTGGDLDPRALFFQSVEQLAASLDEDGGIE